MYLRVQRNYFFGLTQNKVITGKLSWKLYSLNYDPRIGIQTWWKRVIQYSRILLLSDWICVRTTSETRSKFVSSRLICIHKLYVRFIDRKGFSSCIICTHDWEIDLVFYCGHVCVHVYLIFFNRTQHHDLVAFIWLNMDHICIKMLKWPPVVPECMQRHVARL